MTLSVQQHHLVQWETGVCRQYGVEPHNRFLGYVIINLEERIFDIIVQSMRSLV